MSRVKMLVAAVATVAGLAVTGGVASAAPPVVMPARGGYTPPGYVPPGGFVPPGRVQPPVVVQPSYRPGYPPNFPGGHDTDYVVLVRCKFDREWEFYGRYETLRQAERVEHMLLHRGERVRIKPVHDYRPGYPW